jgi:hypothetical protein
MAFNVTSAGLVTTGTSGADLIVVNTGGFNQSTILGLTGSDTINVVGYATSTSIKIDAAGDKDVVNVSGTGSLSGGTILLGAGADFLSGNLTSYNNGIINGGDGNDTINLSGTVFSGSSIGLGGGSDRLAVTGASLASATVAGGSGDDNIQLLSITDLGSAQILGGGGADSIFISGGTSNTSGVSINGDSSVNGGGADTITINSELTGAIVKGKGGKDIITMSGVAGTGSQILGNAGADSITIKVSITETGNLVGGGSGNDTIFVSGLAQGNTINGGGGTDKLSVDGASSGHIFGGAGSDSIDLQAGFSGTVAFEALTDSTLAKMDFISGEDELGGTGMRFTLSAVTTSKLGTGIAGGNGFSGTNLHTGVIGSGQFSTAGNVTARAALLDAQGGRTANTTFVFEAANQNFLFIQGGAAGTADDLVAKVGTGIAAVLTGVGFTLGSGSITL